MHGIGIAKKIIEEVNKKKKKNIKAITLEIGELANITAEELKKNIEDLSNWQVNLLKKKSVVKCKCGYKGRANIKERLHDIILFNCPKCNEIPEVISGDKIIIKSIEIK